MLNWLKNKAGSSRFVGVDVHDDGFAVAVVEIDDIEPPVVTAAGWYALDTGESFKNRLAVAVRQLDIRGLPVFAVLPHSAYSLVQLEAPELETDEMREAMRWRVKDLIDFPVEEAIVDIFPLPESHRPGAPALLYVVVAREQAVEGLAESLIAAGLEIRAIDILEMAIRNLSMYLDKPGRPRAYLHLQPGQTIIEIADGSQVYLSRQVMQDYDPAADPVLLNAQMENLALEVQRSLDYFESQYALGAADRLSVISSEDALFIAFSEVAGNFLTVPIERFSSADVDVADVVEQSGLQKGVTALGAAMRGIPWAA